MKGPPLQPRFDTINAALRSAADWPDSGLRFVTRSESETPLSWAELYRRARRTAGWLRALGLRPGDRTALILPTSVAFMDAFFGTLLAAGTPTPLCPPMRLGRGAEYHASTARMIKMIGARFLLTDRRTHHLLSRTLSDVDAELGFIDVEMFDDAPGVEVDELVPPDQLGLIQFSSGATVAPKAVALSHRQLMAQCAALMELMPAPDDGPQIGVSWLPLHHDMGLIGPLLTAVCYGESHLALIRPEHFLAKPAMWLRAISRHRALLSPAPNFAYALCLRRVRDDEMEGTDLTSWRYALNGGDVISMDVVRGFVQRFARWGFRPNALTPVYGLAEAALAVTFSSTDEPACSAAIDPATLATVGEVVPGNTEIASVGAPVPGMEIEIRDDQGRGVGDRRLGRVFARGASVMTGYYEDPEATTRTLQDGWLDTGDLGFKIDEELYISGRSKDVVIIRGANYACQTFETYVERLEGVRAGSVVAVGYVPPGADGEELLILAERTLRGDPAGDPSLAAEIHAAVVENVAVRPHLVCVLEPGALPRTSSGKLRRAEALRRFVCGELAGSSTPPSPSCGD